MRSTEQRVTDQAEKHRSSSGASDLALVRLERNTGSPRAQRAMTSHFVRFMRTPGELYSGPARGATAQTWLESRGLIQVVKGVGVLPSFRAAASH